MPPISGKERRSHGGGTAASQRARFQAVCVAWSWFRQNGITSFHPPAGNAHRWADAFGKYIAGNNKKMKSLSWLALFLITIFALVGCTPVRPTMQTPVTNVTEPASPTEMVSLPSDTPSPTITLTTFDTLQPAQVTETLQPLTKEPMNCVVPCFWGIIPGKTSLDEAKVFFSRLGFTSREGEDFYSTEYKSDSGGFAATFHAPGVIIENIVVTPYIPTPKEGSPREWIAFSPETLIKRYGIPSRVEFAVGLGPNIGINMIMYFDASDLIIHYSGYNMTPESFCPLTAPFDHVRLWIGPNPPDMPSFETVSLEESTTLTMEQFTQLIMGDPKKACFSVKGEVSP